MSGHGRYAGCARAARRSSGRVALIGELGIEPGRSLRELHAAILRQDPALELGVRPEPAMPATGSPESTFVGRRDELAALVAGLDDAYAGQGRLFLVTGEPGVGKSRLAEELVEQARARGARILVGRCWEAGGAPAYWPWVQSLRGYVRATDAAALRSQLGSGAGEVAQLLPELRQLLHELPEPVSAESESARFRLFDAAAGFLRNAAADRPIVLVLEDLHAADAPSLLLLRFLAREIDSTRLLVIATCRDVDPVPGRPLTAAMTALARERSTGRLTLGGLSEAEVAVYLKLAAPGIASAELAVALYDKTEGNPLFVCESVRLLALEGVTASVARTGVTIPESTRDVIARRFAHLSEDCNRALEVAAVVGREFPLSTLAGMSDSSEDTLLELLDEALRARVLTDVPGDHGKLRFAHALIRDTLYEGLSATRRVHLHRTAVDALATLHGDGPGPHLAELAHQSIAARDLEGSLRYAQRAGDWALGQLAFEEAVRLYRSALAALERSKPVDGPARHALLLALGEATARAGDVHAARSVFLEAAELARRDGSAHDLALAAFGYGGRSMYGRAGDDPFLVPLLEEALAALGDNNAALSARLAARLAGALRDEPDRERRDRLSTQAISLARSSDDQAALASALDGRAAAIMAPDTVHECLALATELRDVAAAVGDPERVSHGHLHRLIAQIMLGDLASADAELAALNMLAERLKQPSELWQVAAARAMLALARGELAEAPQLVEEAFAIGQQAEPMAIPVHRVQRYTLCDFVGRLEEVEPEVHDLVSRYPARTAFRGLTVHLAARLGRAEEARRSLTDLVADDLAAFQFDNEWLLGASLLAETAALIGDVDAAAVLHRRLLPWASLNVLDHPEVVRGSVSRYIGLLAATRGRLDEAAAHFETALAANERMGLRPWLAYTRADYARTLLTRQARGDAERAAELLEQSLDGCRTLGMTAYPDNVGTIEWAEPARLRLVHGARP